MQPISSTRLPLILVELCRISRSTSSRTNTRSQYTVVVWYAREPGESGDMGWPAMALASGRAPRLARLFPLGPSAAAMGGSQLSIAAAGGTLGPHQRDPSQHQPPHPPPHATKRPT